MGDNFACPDDHIVTVDVMHHQGLLVAGFTLQQKEQSKRTTNGSRFNSAFGALPAVLCLMYEDLQKLDAVDINYKPPQQMCLKPSCVNFKWFLRVMYYLRNYPT